MAKELDIEDEKFEALLAEKRHKDLTKMLGNLATAMSNKDDKEIINAINGQSGAISELVKVIMAIPKPEKPEVNVQISQSEIVSSLENICKRIEDSNTKVIEALSSKPLVESFEFIYQYGDIRTAKVNYKNQIPKSKFTA